MQLTDEQEKVRDCRAPLQVVTARAGTGKTNTMVEKIAAEVCERGVEPRRVAAITFTVAGARELRDRLLGEDIEIGVCGTLHSYAMRRLFITPEQLVDEDEARSRAAAAMERLAIRGVSLTAVMAALEDGQQLGNVGLAARQVRAELRACNRLTLGMVLLEFRDHLRSDAEDERGRPPLFDLLVVDEAQDTGPLDAEIYDLLTARQKVFIGDPLQAIYGFRGCTSRFFRKMERRADAVLPMAKTWRCAPAIVAAANRLFENVPPMTGGTAEDPGTVEVREYGNEAEEAVGLAWWARSHSGTRAILCRYNADVQRLAMELRRREIPVRVRLPEPDALLVAALRVLLDDDDGNRLRLMAELGPQRAEKARWPDAEEMRDTARALMALGVGHDEAVTAAPPGTTVKEALEAAVRGEEPGRGRQTDAVTVGTIHGAKGREFDHVAVAAALKPPGGADFEEERRIFYVAITRARFSVLATLAKRVVDPRTGETKGAEASPFLAALRCAIES